MTGGKEGLLDLLRKHFHFSFKSTNLLRPPPSPSPPQSPRSPCPCRTQRKSRRRWKAWQSSQILRRRQLLPRPRRHGSDATDWAAVRARDELTRGVDARLWSQ